MHDLLVSDLFCVCVCVCVCKYGLASQHSNRIRTNERTQHSTIVDCSKIVDHSTHATHLVYVDSRGFPLQSHLL